MALLTNDPSKAGYQSSAGKVFTWASLLLWPSSAVAKRVFLTTHLLLPVCCLEVVEHNR